MNEPKYNAGFCFQIIAAGAAFCVARIGAGMMPDELFLRVFCKPAAAGAALLCGAASNETLIVSNAGGVFEVVRSCGAADFFSMMGGALAWHAAGCRRRADTAWRLALVFPAAFALTVVVNSARLAVVVATHPIAVRFLPERFGAAAHMVAGVLVFFPALLATWYICDSRSKK
jgi:Transmembrane exosortase (Exosortase_EpsH).